MQFDEYQQTEDPPLGLETTATAAGTAPCVESGARSLMRAVLEQALVDAGVGGWVGRSAGPCPRNRLVQQDVRRWFRSSDRTHLFSFLTICDTLGLDPRPIRLKVLAGGELPVREHRRPLLQEGRDALAEVGRLRA